MPENPDPPWVEPSGIGGRSSDGSQGTRTSDPVHPGPSATSTALTKYKKDLGLYTKEILDVLSQIGYTGEDLWVECVNAWSENSIRYMSDAACIRLKKILFDGGLLIESGVGIDKKEAVWKCLSELRLRPGFVTHTPTTESPKTTSVHVRQNHGSRSISSLMKAYHGRPLFSGEWGDNITEAIELYETMTALCGMNDDGKLKGIPVMLKGSALSYYNSSLKSLTSYDACINGLSSWYTSEEQRNRLLQDWQNLKLSTFMTSNSEKSQIAVFRIVSSRLSSIQRQLHVDYHKDRFLRDQLVRCADTPQIERALKERIPSTAQEATQRIAALLSSKPGSASSFIGSGHSEMIEDEANALLDHRFGGQARKNFRNYRRPRNKNGSRKVRGCWVCGKDHFARDHHERSEIKASLERHRKKGRVYVAIEDAVHLLEDG